MPYFEGDACYYCLFCLSRCEAKAMQDIENKCSEVKAIVVTKEKWKKESGKRITVSEAMLPGYVFLRSEKELRLSDLFSAPNVLRVLGEADRGYPF